MGGVSKGTMVRDAVAGRAAIRMRGDLSLENNGGFVQIALDLSPYGGVVDASAWSGIELDVFGNGEEYGVHLRTDALTRPWQSYRQIFSAYAEWRTVQLPFDHFVPHRTDVLLDTAPSPALSPGAGLLVELLRASNNYIANQVFLEIGGHRLGGPVSLEKSLQLANDMLAAHGRAAAIHLEEGSGISRNNHFTARGLAKVLELFAPHADLLHGHDGGMNKTGTMEGVRTLAGYADTSSHGQVRFVISLANNDGEMRFRLLRAIESGL